MTNSKLETPGWCYIACEIKATHRRDGTELGAVLINDGARDAWIPRSQIEDPDHADLEVGQHVKLLVAEWIAKEKGLI